MANLVAAWRRGCGASGDGGAVAESCGAGAVAHQVMVAQWLKAVAQWLILWRCGGVASTHVMWRHVGWLKVAMWLGPHMTVRNRKSGPIAVLGRCNTLPN